MNYNNENGFRVRDVAAAVARVTIRVVVRVDPRESCFIGPLNKPPYR